MTDKAEGYGHEKKKEREKIERDKERKRINGL